MRRGLPSNKVMKLKITLLAKTLKWPYSHLVICFSAGVGLELFMNLFHIGEANIYRSVRRSLSDSEAKKQFELERALFEKLEDDRSEI